VASNCGKYYSQIRSQLPTTNFLWCLPHFEIHWMLECPCNDHMTNPAGSTQFWLWVSIYPSISLHTKTFSLLWPLHSFRYLAWSCIAPFQPILQVTDLLLEAIRLFFLATITTVHSSTMYRTIQIWFVFICQGALQKWFRCPKFSILDFSTLAKLCAPGQASSCYSFWANFMFWPKTQNFWVLFLFTDPVNLGGIIPPDIAFFARLFFIVFL